MLLGIGLFFFSSVLFTALDAHAGSGKLVHNRAANASFEILIDGHLAASGVMVDRRGFALTSAHILPSTDKKLEGRSANIGRRVFEVVARDPGHDLALLRFPRRTGGYATVKISGISPAPGTDIYLVGSAMYRHGLFLKGAVARTAPTFEYLSEQGHYARVMHVSGPSPPGSSGGAWVDERGRLVGIQSGLVHNNGAPVGLGYMSPRSAIKRLMRIKRDVVTGTVGLGVEELWEQTPEFIARFPKFRSGLVVKQLTKEGPAAMAGIREGALITAVSESPVKTRDEFLSLIRELPAGSTLGLTIQRDDGSNKAVELVSAGIK